jgi:YidC/Oxa1 family membrane protein insertase
MQFLYELFGNRVRWIYDFVGNYGLSIVLFSLFAKVILTPLTVKQTRSMQMMKFMNPKMTDLQKKYANNKEKLNEEMMKLYKQYGYNPLSGCLPMLLQMPIIIGLFGVLRQPAVYVFTEAEYALVSQKFLWIQNLTLSPMGVFQESGFSGTFFLALIIPAISVLLTVLQQKQTQQASEQAGQKGMQIFMTIFIAYVGFTFSQGLALYWVLQTGLGILSTIIIEKYFPAKLPEEKSVK